MGMHDPMGPPEPISEDRPAEAKYKIQEEVKRRLDNAFIYHKPKEDQPARYTEIRETARHLSYVIVQNSKDSRERSLALTKLEEAVMWANAGIARTE